MNKFIHGCDKWRSKVSPWPLPSPNPTQGDLSLVVSTIIIITFFSFHFNTCTLLILAVDFEIPCKSLGYQEWKNKRRVCINLKKKIEKEKEEKIKIYIKAGYNQLVDPRSCFPSSNWLSTSLSSNKQLLISSNKDYSFLVYPKAIYLSRSQVLREECVGHKTFFVTLIKVLRRTESADEA